MRGALIKNTSQVRRERRLQVDSLLETICATENQKKSNPSYALSATLLQYCITLLIHNHEKILGTLKATYYNLANKPGAYLA